MRVPVSWLREYVDAPTDPARLEQALVGQGIEVESIVDLRSTVDGPLLVGRVLTAQLLTQFKKTVRYCTVDVGQEEPRGIICGEPSAKPAGTPGILVGSTPTTGDSGSPTGVRLST